MPDQKNLILAIAISIAVLLGFQFVAPMFLPAPPQQTTQAPALAPEEAAVPGTPGAAIPQVPADSPGLPQPAQAATRAEAIAQTPRVRIDNPRIHGSINLVGGRLDDVTLRDYRETVDPNSPEIVLLSPRTAPSAYYADFGWAGADAAVALPGPDTLWTADREVLTADTPVTLHWDSGQGLVFERTISLDPNYMFTVVQRVHNSGTTPVDLAPYGRVQRYGTPYTMGFFVLHEGPYGVFDGTLQEYSYDTIQDDGTVAYDTTGGWLGFTDKYWLVALIPDQQVPVAAQFVHQGQNGDRYLATVQDPTQTIAPGATIETTNRLFAGAKEVALVDGYGTDLNITSFDLAIDFGWFYWITKPFFYALAWLYGLVGNFGVAILIFTVGLKLLFFPLADKSYRSMAKMKALQPEMVKLRERFGDDRVKMNQELMALYKKEKVNPAAGCLPIVIQIPVFFALYKVLFVTIEMRHAPFFGWVHDLSAPDPTTIVNLFGLLPFTPPATVLGVIPLMIGVWPLIMGVTMFLQQKLNPAPADPVQARIFMALPIVFTFMLASFPVGLVIYWAWNNSLSILQQWVIMKRMGVKIGGGVEKPPEVAPPSAQRKAAKAEAPAPATPIPANKPAAKPAARRRAAPGGRRKG